MWSERIAFGIASLALSGPALADYTHAPFHDRPLEVAVRALQVLEGEAVPVPKDDVPMAAAVAALLLVSEIGLAEAFEEAVEAGDDDAADQDDAASEADADPYTVAHDLLQRVRPWVAALPQSAEIDDLMGRLDALMPGSVRPARLDADPEAAEIVAQALVGVMERAADSDLYLGRDLGRALDTLRDLSAQGCAVEDPAQRQAHFEIAALYFEDVLEAPLSVMAAEPAEEIEDAYALLMEGETVATACHDLIAGYGAAKAMLFPGVSQ